MSKLPTEEQKKTWENLSDVATNSGEVCVDLEGMEKQTCRLAYIRAKLENDLDKTFDLHFKRLISNGVEPNEAVERLSKET